MPIYEYLCKVCKNKFDYLILPGKDEQVECPSCGSLDIEKQVTVFSRPKNSRSSGNSDGTCCGMTSPCDNPKRCCES